MAPVSANMAQMAQNMSHHGNLSHLNQNSAPPAAASPGKPPAPGAPLSLVQDKVTASQPLALTRTPEKKEPDSTGPANGTIDSPKSGANAPAALKPQNPEPNKDKQDIAKTSPSTPKPPEKPVVVPTPSTPQKAEVAGAANQAAEGPAQPKVATANEPPEKSPSKPAEPTPAPTADVAPSQSNSKPVPESANNQPASQAPAAPAAQPEKAPTPVKQPPVAETAKTEPAKPEPPKVEEKKPETPVKPVNDVENKPKPEEAKEKVETPKKEDQVDGKVEKPAPATPKVEEKPAEEKKEVKKPEVKPKSTLKLATVTPPMRKRRQLSPAKADGATPAKKPAEGDSTPSSESRTKRNRTKVQLYQSPTPELAMATKLSASAGRATPTKPNDDKLIVFYKNEYLAVRNAEGGFYVCQAMQNVYRSTRKIKIRWLSQDKAADPSGETYKPDFYDVTDMECVLTTLSLARAGGAGGGGAQLLRAAERARATSILQRALKAEQSGAPSLDLTPEHPDGLDLSLYTAESQLDSKPRKRRADKPEPAPAKETPSPAKKPRTPKRSPKSARKATPKTAATNNNKRKSKSPGSRPVVASTSKTATAVTEKANKTPAKTTPKRNAAKKVDTPVATPTRGRRAAKESKPSPLVATPSTSTGKATRTPRKPPSRK